VTSGATTTLTVGSITIAGVGARTNIAGTFTQALSEGHSYILTLDLRGVAFAGSNIYWDGTQLTFKPAGYVGQENFYQGLYFRWGSMVGLSSENANFALTDSIYYPTSATAWASSITNGGTHLISTMSFVDANARGGVGYANSYVTNGYAADNNGQAFNYTSRLGDICRRIDPGYRLPTAEEGFAGNTTPDFYSGWINSSSAGWTKGTNSIGGAITFPAEYTGVLNKGGRSILDYDTYANFGGGFAVYQGVSVFPAAGTFAFITHVRGDVGSVGQYMTSSVRSNSEAFHFGFADNYLYITYLSHVRGGGTIRCVKN
jgi:hypothetical protein